MTIQETTSASQAQQQQPPSGSSQQQSPKDTPVSSRLVSSAHSSTLPPTQKLHLPPAPLSSCLLPAPGLFHLPFPPSTHRFCLSWLERKFGGPFPSFFDLISPLLYLSHPFAHPLLQSASASLPRGCSTLELAPCLIISSTSPCHPDRLHEGAPTLQQKKLRLHRRATPCRPSSEAAQSPSTVPLLAMRAVSSSPCPVALRRSTRASLSLCRRL